MSLGKLPSKCSVCSTHGSNYSTTIGSIGSDGCASSLTIQAAESNERKTDRGKHQQSQVHHCHHGITQIQQECHQHYRRMHAPPPRNKAISPKLTVLNERARETLGNCDNMRVKKALKKARQKNALYTTRYLPVVHLTSQILVQQQRT